MYIDCFFLEKKKFTILLQILITFFSCYLCCFLFFCFFVVILFSTNFMSFTIISHNISGYFNQGGRAAVVYQTIEKLKKAVQKECIQVIIFTDTQDRHDEQSGLVDFILSQSGNCVANDNEQMQIKTLENDSYYIMYEEKSCLPKAKAGISVLVHSSLIRQRVNKKVKKDDEKDDEKNNEKDDEKDNDRNYFIGRISLNNFSEINQWCLRELQFVAAMKNEKPKRKIIRKSVVTDQVVLPLLQFPTEVSERNFHKEYYVVRKDVDYDKEDNNKNNSDDIDDIDDIDDNDSNFEFDTIDDFTGRMLLLQFTHFVVIAIHSINSGVRLKYVDEKTLLFDQYVLRIVNEVQQKYGPVILMGNFNVLRDALDVWNAEEILGTFPGFSLQERMSFDHLMKNTNLVDSFRQMYPDEIMYTYFPKKTKLMDSCSRRYNRGFRTDYALVSERLFENVKESRVVDPEDEIISVLSEHRPIVLELF